MDDWIVTWPKIAKYLGVSIRTAKHYHYGLHMPIHRGYGKVRALRLELDEFLIAYLKKKKHFAPSLPHHYTKNAR
jgi:hypothetical protein